MAEYRHLSNAPINEALIDIKVKFNSTITKEKFEAFCNQEEIASIFPKCNPRRRDKIQSEFSTANPPKITSDSEDYARLCFSDDGKSIIQPRQDGFSYNRLNPYTSWNDIKPKAVKYWNLYKDFFNPLEVTRLAVRYINKLSLPIKCESPISDYSEYISTIPSIPSKMNNTCKHFFMRLVIPHKSNESHAIITVLQPEEKKQHENIPMIFDVDVILEKTFKISDETIWDHIEELKKYENSIFFESLEEKLLMEYE